MALLLAGICGTASARTAYIKTIPASRARGELRQSYRYLHQVTGSSLITPRLFTAFSLKPGSLRRVAEDLDLTLWRSREPRRQLELAGSLVSRLNTCHY